MRIRPKAVISVAFWLLLTSSQLLASVQPPIVTETIEKKLWFGEGLSKARLKLSECALVKDKVKDVFGADYKRAFVAAMLEIVRQDGVIKSITIFIFREDENTQEQWVILTKDDDDDDYKIIIDKLEIR